MTVLLDFMPKILTPLCARLWNAKYPSFIWTNDAAIGDVFEKGSAIEDELVLTGDLVTGGVTKANGDIVWRKVTTTADLRAKLKKGDTIRIGTEHFTLISEPTVGDFLLNKPFSGEGGAFQATKTKRDVLPAKMRRPAGKNIDGFVMKKLRSGKLETFDATAFNMFLLGCTHELLPAPRQTEADYTTALAAGVLSVEEQQAFHVKGVINIKNAHLSHRTGSQMGVTAFEKIKKQFLDCIAVCAQPGNVAVLEKELHALCAQPLPDAAEQTRLEQKFAAEQAKTKRTARTAKEAKKELAAALQGYANVTGGGVPPPAATSVGNDTLGSVAVTSEGTSVAEGSSVEEARAEKYAAPLRAAVAKQVEEAEARARHEEKEKRTAEKQRHNDAKQRHKDAKHKLQDAKAGERQKRKDTITTARAALEATGMAHEQARAVMKSVTASPFTSPATSAQFTSAQLSATANSASVADGNTGAADTVDGVTVGEGGGGGRRGAGESAAAFEWTVLAGLVTYTKCEEQDSALKGGQGQVYKVYSGVTGSDKKVYWAAKVPLDPKRLRGHAREIQVYFNLNPQEMHHLAFVSDIVRHEGVPLLIMEWADGGSLKVWIAKQVLVREKFKDQPAFISRLVEQAVGSAIQIARGLEALHALNMVHQDLKPANVLMYGSILKIADFGLCCSSGDASEGGDSMLSQVAAVVGGTRGFMAPEQMVLRAKRQIQRSGASNAAELLLAMVDGEGEKEVATSYVALDEPQASFDIWALGLLIASMVSTDTAAAAATFTTEIATVDLRDATAVIHAAVGMSDKARATMVSSARKLPSGSKVADLLSRCFCADLSKRPGASACVIALQEGYRKLAGKPYASSESLVEAKKATAASTFHPDIFSAFRPRERQARFQLDVLGDAATAADLLQEQLKEELEKALELTNEICAPEPVGDLLVKVAASGSPTAKQGKSSPRKKSRKKGKKQTKVEAAAVCIEGQKPGEVQAGLMGLYKVEAGTQSEERPVYSQVRGNNVMYYSDENRWEVGCTVGEAGRMIAFNASGRRYQTPDMVAVHWQLFDGSSFLKAPNVCVRLATEQELQGVRAEEERKEAEMRQMAAVATQIKAALEDGLRASAALAQRPSWLPAVGGELVKAQSMSSSSGEKSKLLPVMVDLVLATCEKCHQDANGRIDGETAKEMAALIRQAQRVWASTGDTKCCSHRLGSTTDGDPPVVRLIKQQGDGGIEVVKRLLDVGEPGNEEGVAWLMAPDPGFGGTPLYWASRNGHSEVVGQLLAAGADVNQARTDTGTTPLYSASSNGHSEVVGQLLAAGADVNQATTDDGSTPLYMALSNGHSEVVGQLLAAGADVNQARTDNGSTPLYWASSNGHSEVVGQLLAAGADVNQARTGDGTTPLCMASSNGHSEVVGQLLAAGADVNQAKTDDGSTPLLGAAQGGHHEVVAQLLASGAVAGAHMENNVSPLMCAAWGGHLQCVEQLLAAGADRTAKMTGANQVLKADAGTTARQLAEREGHAEVVALLA
jgi:ankyrin repeat protein/serine/threonine protein kinase